MMAKLLMITGLGSARDLASGKRGAFYNTLEEFHKYWDRIDIICPRTDNINSGTLNLFGNVYVHISSWPLVLHPIWFLKRGLEIYREQKFDLMTVHEFPPFYNGIGARLLWQFLKVPYILEIFHVPGHPQAASFKEVIYRVIFKFFIKLDASKAKAVRVMNKSQVPDFLIKTGVSRDKIIYIPAIYVDLDIFKPMNLAKKYDLIFVGRLERNKGIDLFIEVVKKTGMRGIIVGDGSLKKDLQASHKLQADIIFHGWAKDSQEISRLINESKILVMPSHNEGGPRVVIEALACGVPVLATPVGIVPDLLQNRSISDQEVFGGRIVGWDVNDMASVATALLNDPIEYQKHSQNGPRIASQFEKRSAIKYYAERLKSLL